MGHLSAGSGWTIGVILHADRPAPALLRRALQSVLQQTSDAWQLVVSVPGEQTADVERVLAWVQEQPRVAVTRADPALGPSRSLNVALEQMDCDWVVVLGPDRILEPLALALVHAATRKDPGARVVYSDSDTVDAAGMPVEQHRRPDWSPQRLRGQCYIDDLVAIEARAVREVGGFRSEVDGAHLHDLLLRVTGDAARVLHLDEVLCHRVGPQEPRPPGGGTNRAEIEAGRRVIAADLERRGLRGDVHEAALPGTFVTALIPRPTLVSVVIPTRGGRALVRGHQQVMVAAAVRSILAHEYVSDYEIVVVHDTDADRGYLTELASLAGPRLRVVDYKPPFNFSAKVNAGAEAAQGEVLVLLNDDVEVITRRWLDQLVALAQQPDVGAVGALLRFEDGTIQHAGHVVGKGHVRHVGFREAHSAGPDGANLVDREVTGVTAAVLAQRRDVWRHVGGLDESWPNNFNDVDYCLRIAAKGYRIVQANSVELYHFESRTRSRGATGTEVRRLRQRWGPQLERDRYTAADDAKTGAAHDGPLRDFAARARLFVRTRLDP